MAKEGYDYPSWNSEIVFNIHIQHHTVRIEAAAWRQHGVYGFSFV